MPLSVSDPQTVRPITPPSAEAYERALRSIGPLADAHLAMLEAQYQAQDRTVTADALADAVGYANHGAVNLQYGTLGRRLGEALGASRPDLNKPTERAGWYYLSEGVRRDGAFLWRMHPPVADALERLGWVGSTPGAYLLTWNPSHWTWDELPDRAAQLRRGERVVQRWSTGNTKSIGEGARVYLYRQGNQGRGLVGSGWVTRGSFEAPHWNDERGGTANYVEVAFDALLDPQRDVLFPPAEFGGHELEGVHWGTQTSGIGLDAAAARRLDALWAGWVAAQREAGAEFLREMESYAEEGVVFPSSERGALYTVADVDDRGAGVARLSASEPARVTASGYARGVRNVMQNGGRFPAVQLDATAAIRNAYFQGPELALSPSSDAVLLLTPDHAADLLAEAVRTLRVDQRGEPKLYKPAVLACVLEGIAAGELTENRIPFDWLAPRFEATLAELGQEGGEEQAALAFFHLASEPFWLLAYDDPEAATDRPRTPAQIRRHVRHARFRTPFWDALQDRGRCHRVRSALREAWWPDGAGVRIDRDLLARAVERTIRPAIVEGGRLAEGEPEGYHHHKVLPTTVALLSRESIDADPVGAVDAALKAHVNLLSQFELMYATTFFGETPESADAVRERLVGLLYGDGDLAERVDRFTSWAQMDDRADGAGRSVNATVASYLLAASQPHRYAFCKPSVYTPAAKALLGEAVGSGSPGERVAHATAFYRTTLSLLRDEHGLPFEDLMHVHIAFYVVKQDDLFPGWKELREGQASGELAQTFEAILADYDRARREEPFGKTDESGTVRPMWALFERAVELLRASGAVQRHPHVRVSWSVGAGNWARVPWIALMDERETTSTQRGTYVVYLFREDATGVYLTLNQGVTDTIKEHGRREGHPILADQARRLREATPQLEGAGFTLDGDVDLRASGGLGADYEVSTVAYTLYEQDRVPQDGRLLDDLGAVLDAYGSVVGGGVTYGGGDDEETGWVADDAARELIAAQPAGRLLLDRKNVILYGPPGTGKTRASLELARHWKRWQGEDTVEQVTFHPTFAYEDFVEGFRPDPDDGTFKRRDGVFVQLCDRARDDEDRQYLLLVDEINRGDVSRILGELVTGLEKDKRGAHAARRLPYSQRPFWVPPNLHVLGTMNTADRSISLMDVAVRRRFAFVETPPDPDVLASAEGHVHDVEGVPLAALLRALNARLHSVGVDRDRAIGHSYLLLREVPGDALDRLADRLRYDVVPMVEEYCYADRQLMRDVLGALVREDGRVDDAVFGDRDRLVRALGAITGGGGIGGTNGDDA